MQFTIIDRFIKFPFKRIDCYRSSRTGGWVLYFLFIGGCFSTDKWLHLLAEQPWMVVFPVGVLAALAVCGAKWLMKAAVK